MFTSIDKAIVALIGSAVFIVNQFGLDVPTEWITWGTAILTPVLTWLVPNKT